MSAKDIKNHVLWWMPVFVWGGIIVAGSSFNSHYLEKIPWTRLDKLVHFVDFLIFGFLLYRALLYSQLKFSAANKAMLAIMIAAVFAVVDECLQHFIPGRAVDVYDYAADYIGLTVGVLLYGKRARIADNKTF